MPIKKSPGTGESAALIDAWAKQWPPQSAGYHITARELAALCGHLRPHQITATPPLTMLAAWRRKYAPATVHQRRIALKGLLAWLHEFGAPTIKLPHVRRPEPRGVTATEDQLRSLMANAPPHMQLLTLLCLETALRFSEALAVTPATYNPIDRTVTVPVKGGKSRCVPTTPAIDELIAIADRHGDRSTPCVFTLKGKTVSKHALHTEWYRLTQKAGIAAANPKETVHPHDLRRTTLTKLYQTTKDLRAVQQYAGHARMTSTLHYLAPLKEEQLRQYHELLKFESGVKQ